MNKTQCPPDEMMLEYAVQEGFKKPAPQEIEKHLAECKSCREKFLVHTEEAQRARRMLANQLPAETPCPDEETLAMYLDKSLDEKQKRKTEKHLARCGLCREQMVKIYRETADLLRNLEQPPEVQDMGSRMVPHQGLQEKKTKKTARTSSIERKVKSPEARKG